MPRPTTAQSEQLRLIEWAVRQAHRELMENDLSGIDHVQRHVKDSPRR